MGQGCSISGNDIAYGSTVYINPASTAIFSFDTVFGSECDNGMIAAPVLTNVNTGQSWGCDTLSGNPGDVTNTNCYVTHDEMTPGEYQIDEPFQWEVGGEWIRTFYVVNTQVCFSTIGKEQFNNCRNHPQLQLLRQVS
jgi:hypothetical protein